MLKVYVIENERKENYEMMKEFSNDNISYIYKSDNFEEKKGYVKIAKSGNCKIWIEKNKLQEVDKKNNLVEYLLIALADVIVINKVYNLSKAFDELDFALDIGKSIYAIPGNINEYNSYFANYVIKQGAGVICNKYDMKYII